MRSERSSDAKGTAAGTAAAGTLDWACCLGQGQSAVREEDEKIVILSEGTGAGEGRTPALRPILPLASRETAYPLMMPLPRISKHPGLDPTARPPGQHWFTMYRNLCLNALFLGALCTV